MYNQVKFKLDVGCQFLKPDLLMKKRRFRRAGERRESKHTSQRNLTEERLVKVQREALLDKDWIVSIVSIVLDIFRVIGDLCQISSE